MDIKTGMEKEDTFNEEFRPENNGPFFCNNPSSDCLLLEILFSSRRSAKIAIREFRLDLRSIGATRARPNRVDFASHSCRTGCWPYSKPHGDPNDHDAHCRVLNAPQSVTGATCSGVISGATKTPINDSQPPAASDRHELWFAMAHLSNP